MQPYSYSRFYHLQMLQHLPWEAHNVVLSSVFTDDAIAAWQHCAENWDEHTSGSVTKLSGPKLPLVPYSRIERLLCIYHF